ncbi:Citreoviridin biosynthesis protein D [Lasiodiplodia hormozganensis]|uniref:Citreoviridin biosynthesis protein D n=1 Tax=Lasiodiplodia hormozganensis TaxID=869390 RepID=A0AA40CHV3_9PEZI|nr:Citreoviridin biosynthesis protein D [Lasiodiplodia hormozganensis]
MVNFNFSTTVLLPALLAAGATTTMVFSANNGMFDAITDIIDDPTITTIPGTADVPLTREWTGVAALDRQFTVLLIFFWPLLDGRHPAGTLHAVHFFGQMGAYWTLMQLEAKREGNKRRIIAYTTLIGLLYQNISVAITIPLWCLLHLFTLPTRTNSATLTASLTLPASEARMLPWAMTLGYVAPSLAMALPSPILTTPLVQQWLASAWQIFPVWIYLARTVVLPPFFTSRASTPSSPAAAAAASYHAASTTHLFALLLAALPHATTLTLSLSSLAFPSLFAPATAAALHPAAVFLPKLSPAGTTGVGLAEGVTRFMQWDELVSSVASVVWAGTVYLRDTRTKGGKRFGVLGVVVRAVGWSVIGGPAAAAVGLVWARDEGVLGWEEVGGKNL